MIGGWATVFFKNRKQPMNKRVRLKRFQKAWGIWQEDPAGMICKCAEADALRSSFPTMLGGLYLREEIDPRDVVKTTSPIFNTPQVSDKPAGDAGAPEPEPPDDGTRPEPSVPELPPNLPASPVKKLRALCLESKIKEKDVIAFLKGLGSVDDNVGSLEELALNSSATLSMLIEQWRDMEPRIKDAIQ